MKSLEAETLIGLPNEEYRSRPGISRSDAARYRGVYGGRAQRYAEVYGKPLFSGNAATTFGSIVDVAFESLISGDDWRSRVVVPPAGVLAADGSRRGGAYKAFKEQLPPGALEATAADLQKVEDIIASIREHKRALALLESTEHSQLSAFWTDDAGHYRKARADGVTKSGEWYDLKTTSSEWRDLRYSFRRYGYDWQAAWYTDAAVAIGSDPFVFRFIVVQTFPPYDVKVLHLTDEDLARARSEIAETLDLVRARRESGNYVAEEYHDEEILSLG